MGIATTMFGGGTQMRVTVSPEQIRSAFEAVKDDPSFDESRGLWERGRPPVEMIQAMCLRPEILRGFAGFGDCVYPGGLLERRVKELVIITASERNDCQFCTNSHCDLVRISDIIADPLVAIAHPHGLAPRERVAVEYTRAAMTDSNHIPDALRGELKELFTDPELVELSFLIGFINMLNLFNNLLEVRYSGEYSVLSQPARA
jgi:alkylhydroperoxidase family enzyme